jgi:hypothetical protein
VAVPQALFEELRTHLAYECFDVAQLPAVSGSSAAHAHAATVVRAPRKSTPTPPAFTAIAAVAQLLGEVKVDDRDDEWMYAIAGAVPEGGAKGPKLVHTAELSAAAARAKALFHGPLATDAVETDVQSFNSSSASTTASVSGPLLSGRSTQRSSFSNAALEPTNRAFILAADLLRARRNAGDTTAGGGVTPTVQAAADADAAVVALEVKVVAHLDAADLGHVLDAAIRRLCGLSTSPSPAAE